LDYSITELDNAFKKLGIVSGNLIYVPSAIFSLGKMSDTKLEDIPKKIYESLMAKISKNGTLCVPAAFEDFARLGIEYDCKRSPIDSSQGLLSKYVADQEDCLRTYSPMNGVAGIGPLSEKICHTHSANSTGEGSAWHKLYQYNSKFLFIGIRPSQALNFIFFIQQRFGVPHLYNKLYNNVIKESGKRVKLKVTALVRYLNPEYKIIEDAQKFEDDLFSLGKIKTCKIGRGNIYLIDSAKEIYNIAMKKLQKDIYYFLKHEPNFVNGMIPTDGATGPMKTDKQRYKNIEKKKI